MVLDLDSGKRVYDWLGAHERVYSALRWSVCFGIEGRLQELAVDAVGLKKGDVVLDLACGAGVNLPHLLSRVGSAGKILAVDHSDGMLNAARSRTDLKACANVDFQQADAAHLELPAGSLNGAICTFGLSAMPGELAALRRVAAAMKPGVRFVALDAKVFTGFARVFNPIAGPLFKYTTNWNYKKDVIRSIREVFEEIDIDEYNCGCNFIAVAKKSSSPELRTTAPG